MLPHLDSGSGAGPRHGGRAEPAMILDLLSLFGMSAKIMTGLVLPADLPAQAQHHSVRLR